MILLIRLQATAIQNYRYHLIQKLFPVLLRGRVMGITNFVSRPFAGLATILCEYTYYPMNYVMVLSFMGLLVVDSVEEIKEKDGYVSLMKENENEEEFWYE